MSCGAAAGPRVAAFFDIDGTLLEAPSLERRFFGELRRNGWIPVGNYLSWAARAAWLLPRGISAITHGNKKYLRGISVDAAVRHFVAPAFYDQGVARAAWHAEHGHAIMLVSGTIEPLARLTGLALECELEARGVVCRIVVRATLLEAVLGYWTGQICGEAVVGEAKRRAVVKFAREGAMELRECYAYGNSLADGAMLSAVGKPHAVNPGREFARLARLLQWPICEWRDRKDSELKQIHDRSEEAQRIETTV